MSTPKIQLNGVSVTYDHKRVLSNIFLEIEAGKIYGLVGPNGAGKSTLFKAILGLVDIQSGLIRFGDQTVEDWRQKIAYVPQKDEVDWSFPATVLDIVLMGRYPYKKWYARLDKKDHEIAMTVLKKVGMADFSLRQIGELSGGQQQRVFMARALCQEAAYYFLDEPFAGVDITTEEKIIEILKELAVQGNTLLVVHHDLATVSRYFDRVILLNQRLIAAGDVATTFTDENVRKTYGGQLSILHKLKN